MRKINLPLFQELNQTSRDLSESIAETLRSRDVCLNSSKSGILIIIFEVFASFSMYLAWIFNFGGYHLIDLAESFLLVFFSSQTERFSLHLGQLKVHIHMYIIIHKKMLSCLDFFRIGWYHAIDLAESFLMVYLSPQMEQFSVHFGQSKVSYAICYMLYAICYTHMLYAIYHILHTIYHILYTKYTICYPLSTIHYPLSTIY